ncbi:30S ribosomal protein S11 [Candidatus Woesebacteria bacterium RBG_16_39_8b]|uniref:Small ribosomal subunit protein uS11 n=1 Tax=Candidatus Woesebacteria bacterium RBG_16_39_8b TaxID=1802482 RepID=A0A1F7XCV9_9BACT|nr:MAG: 30S ribosomal protein S11 [Candidatus Woesebacteria bacterium RBG_16_39_8b]
MAEDKKVLKTKTKKGKRSVDYGKIFISATFNNTIVTITDSEGKTLSWSSSGAAGFKGTRKSTPYAATTAVDKALKDAKDKFGLKEAEVYVKGPGPGRDASLRAIRAAGLKIALIADVTPIPHNGPRPRKKRRV